MPKHADSSVQKMGISQERSGQRRQMREDVATLRLEMEGLQAERDMRLKQGQIRRAGSGVDVGGVMAWACEVEQRRFAVQRRKTAERALDQAHEALREVIAEVRSLRAQLQEANSRLAELTGELKRWQVREAAVQRLLERLPWLTWHYERELNGSGHWPEQVKVGFCFISLLFGKRKWHSLRHLIGVPAMREVRG
jgi:DNA repair exonuclease SbcCD ATPase subunit